MAEITVSIGPGVIQFGVVTKKNPDGTLDREWEITAEEHDRFFQRGDESKLSADDWMKYLPSGLTLADWHQMLNKDVADKEGYIKSCCTLRGFNKRVGEMSVGQSGGVTICYAIEGAEKGMVRPKFLRLRKDEFSGKAPAISVPSDLLAQVEWAGDVRILSIDNGVMETS